MKMKMALMVDVVLSRCQEEKTCFQNQGTGSKRVTKKSTAKAMELQLISRGNADENDSPYF